jgi:hypothetical protein
MFVLVNVKVWKIEKIELDGLLDGMQAVQDGNAIFGPAVRSIPVELMNKLSRNCSIISENERRDSLNKFRYSPKR